jgi:type I restriction enzyme S subunit
MKLVKLGNLASIQTGKIDVNKAVVGGRYPFFTCSRDVYEINDAPFEGKAVLVAGNGDLNVKYYEGKFNAYQRTYFLFVNNEEELLPRYLYWFLESYVGQLRSDSIGSTIKYIKMGNLTDAEIPLLSVEKQLEIVEKLDSAFAEIDLLETNLEVNVGKTHDLLQSIQDEALTASSEDWGPCKIGDLGKWITGSTPSTAKKEFWGNEVPFVTPADLNASGELGEIGRRISKLGSEQVRVVFAPSVLLVCIGATLGKVAWTSETITTNQQINTLQVDIKKSNNKFMMYLLSSPSVQKKLWDSSTGTTVPILNKGNLENIDIFIPSLERQVEIVKKLDNAFAEIELLAARIQIEKDNAVALRQSLLSIAFTREEAVA